MMLLMAREYSDVMVFNPWRHRSMDSIMQRLKLHVQRLSTNDFADKII